MKTENPQAFPSDTEFEWSGGTKRETHTGMTLRDYFAGQALVGMLKHQEAFENPDKTGAWAYEYADAMLEERSK